MRQVIFQNFRVLFIDEIDSTNQWMQNRIKSGVSISDLVLCADYQTSGKGMGENHWHSEKGKNLLFSLGMDAGFIAASAQFLITQIIALAVVDELSALTREKDFRIKWPNDIFYQRKKLGGVLISNTIRNGQLDESVIGVGLNINQANFPEWIPRPVSLRQIVDREFDLQKILKGILRRFRYRVNQAQSMEGLGIINNEYHQKLFRIGEWHRYKIKEEIAELRIKGIGEYGMLVMETREGKTIPCDFKTIRFLF
jgi:BirA family biotin operon repressor/biotin-[acetyl-CoA-carboxylase] ligase